ncbi:MULTISPECIES: mandelate racemase/muconate lactonizing enzyme family protein [unclassified Nocardioides]|uniref:mandelate racemase/muconate lactonizing enzyme family protein n=1 Tax=unclassified Nocardioides TaxID=2615069 RepID=UPI000056FA43|nr:MULTISPECIES: mandelate racemase/muconate lactonizing enzyme family protein [unclassified Nocardioides]ABL80368.1 Mandelate racemase/muconate lactonizing enzyme, C-terminal domain protein [Nocardioides sp. JS614]
MSTAPAPAVSAVRAASTLSADDLTIERIEVIPMRVPLARLFQGSHYSMSTRCTIVTRLHTRCGLVSEVYNGDTDAEQSVIVGIIRDEIVPQLIGRSALAHESCWEAMLPPTYDILRDRSVALQAIACLDSAIWDVVGKAVGLPLFQLWGGYRDRLPAICIGGYYSDDEADIGRQIERYLDLGFAGCKFKVGRLTPAEDAHRTRLARKAAGDDFVLMVDANQGFTRRGAIEFAGLTEDLDLRWFEEPVGWVNDRLSMRDVRLTTGIQVVAGQSEDTRAGLRDLITAGAVDACNADASWIGGPSEWRRVAALASMYEVDMAHHEEPQISAHLLASIPHGTYLETFDPDRDPIFWNMIANRRPFQDGDYLVPEGPGFGLELDWDYIERYRSDPAS